MPGVKPVDRRSHDFAATFSLISNLQTERGVRDAHGLFFIEGVRNFVRAVDHGHQIQRIVYSERLLIAAIARQLVRRCRRAGIDTLNVTPEQFRQVSQSKRASGIAAIVRQKWMALSAVVPGQGLAWTVLETVRSPGNLGTLIRSSQAVGGAGFILIGNRIDPYGREIVRASMGAVFSQRFVRTDWDGFRTWAHRFRPQIVGATPEGAVDLHRTKFSQTPLLMLGEERKGLTNRQRGLCTELVRIPMQDGTESLNVGVAGSLMLYEVFRNQRR